MNGSASFFPTLLKIPHFPESLACALVRWGCLSSAWRAWLAWGSGGLGCLFPRFLRLWIFPQGKNGALGCEFRLLCGHLFSILWTISKSPPCCHCLVWWDGELWHEQVVNESYWGQGLDFWLLSIFLPPCYSWCCRWSGFLLFLETYPLCECICIRVAGWVSPFLLGQGGGRGRREMCIFWVVFKIFLQYFVCVCAPVLLSARLPRLRGWW